MKDKAISALEAVHSALKPLKPEERQRVLASVHALLETTTPRAPASELAAANDSGAPIARQQTRPVAIRELIQDKKPRSHPQFITLFAYYREKYQNQPAFARNDLKSYYSISKEPPPKNFDRDFVAALMKGWLHEEGENSYITSKGIEAVESSFVGRAEGMHHALGRKTLRATKRKRADKKSH